MTRCTLSDIRNNFFALLEQVVQGTQIIIEKDKQEVAVISAKRRGTDLKALLKASREMRGILKNYDPRDNPLRRKGAKKFLGRIDRALSR